MDYSDLYFAESWILLKHMFKSYTTREVKRCHLASESSYKISFQISKCLYSHFMRYVGGKIICYSCKFHMKTTPLRSLIKQEKKTPVQYQEKLKKIKIFIGITQGYKIVSNPNPMKKLLKIFTPHSFPVQSSIETHI